ncbi:MAG: hypothetical protein WB797_01535 [Nocardioides sp.]
MLYTVECSFAEPAREAEWNDFYSESKLPKLVSVTGFHTSQRFGAVSSGCPTYLAVHSVDGPHVLNSEEYLRKGGGSFARWQADITDWHRNLYDGLDRAPEVSTDEYLLLSAVGPGPLARLGLTAAALHATDLERSPERRWLARSTDTGPDVLAALPKGVHAYVPMTPRLTGVQSAASPGIL